MNISFLKKDFFWLCLILILAFIVRTYKIDNPVADWHSWRQADTAAVARNFFQEGFNPLVPKYDDMSPVSDNSLPNPQRYRFVEFPIYNIMVYGTYLLNGGVDERLARLVSIVMSLGSTVFMYLIVKKEWGNFTGLISALFFAILPYNIYYSRVILPEPTLIFFSLVTLYFTKNWIEKYSLFAFLISAVFASLSLLVKPMAVFLFLPLMYVFLAKEKRIWPIPLKYFIWAFFLLAPFILWRLWIGQHPEGIPASSWLLNGNGIRFKPAFWRWIIQDRFGREILTVCGTVLFAIGALIKPKIHEGIFLQLLLISSFLYLSVFATGNVQHDYYQILIIPALVAFLARGLVCMMEGIPNFLPRIFTLPIAIFLIIMTLGLGWYEVSGLYQINNPAIVAAGKEADKILPKNATVVAPYGGDTAFLYQTNRHGFPIEVSSIKDMVSKYGVDYYISVNKDQKTNWLMQRYEIVENNPQFVILNLTKPNPNFKSDNSQEPS